MDIEARLRAIREENDPNRKNLLVASLVSERFRALGVDPVVVGGTAVEVYTEGRYVSADVDICFAGPTVPSARQRQEAMAGLGQALGVRQWKVGDVLVDLLGAVETSARTPFQQIGEMKIIQIEDLIAERILIAVYPQASEERRKVARLLLATALNGGLTIDRAELQRVAGSSDYDVAVELERLLQEIAQ